MKTALFFFLFFFLIFCNQMRNVHLRLSFWLKSRDLYSNKVVLVCISRALLIKSPYEGRTAHAIAYGPHTDFLNSFAMKAHAGPYGSYDKVQYHLLTQTNNSICFSNKVKQKMVSGLFCKLMLLTKREVCCLYWVNISFTALWLVCIDVIMSKVVLHSCMDSTNTLANPKEFLHCVLTLFCTF